MIFYQILDKILMNIKYLRKMAQLQLVLAPCIKAKIQIKWRVCTKNQQYLFVVNKLKQNNHRNLKFMEKSITLNWSLTQLRDLG